MVLLASSGNKSRILRSILRIPKQVLVTAAIWSENDRVLSNQTPKFLTLALGIGVGPNSSGHHRCEHMEGCLPTTITSVYPAFSCRQLNFIQLARSLRQALKADAVPASFCSNVTINCVSSAYDTSFTPCFRTMSARGRI